MISRVPTILLYHGVPRHGYGRHLDADSFERQIRFLMRHFRFVSPLTPELEDRSAHRIPVALTFDDGYRSNAEVVAPILKKHSVPALFFVASRHAEAGRYLWFSYLNALEAHFPGRSLTLRGEAVDMSPSARRKGIGRLRTFLLGLRPHPQAMYHVIDEELPRLEGFVDEMTLREHYQGMTAEQVGELCRDSLFAAGVHTVDHAFLTYCSRDEAEFQIRENKAWLERCTGQECQTIAYPAGDYDAGTLELCRGLGLRVGFAVSPVRRGPGLLDVPRTGIYSRSRLKLLAKLALVRPLRALGLDVG
jgi:peptidoglycan/xylan/chitin deacetylase (PgdA/CDA1 family)